MTAEAPTLAPRRRRRHVHERQQAPLLADALGGYRSFLGEGRDSRGIDVGLLVAEAEGLREHLLPRGTRP